MTEKQAPCPQGQDIVQDSKDEEQKPKLNEELESLQAKYTRLAADFDNYRKRAQRQTQEVVARANENLLTGLLPVLDNFCIALEAMPEGSERKGMTMIYNQLMAVLENEGVKVIEAIGCSFDPQVHEAVAHAQKPDHPDHTILEELRKGYMLGGKVIRPAAVMVNIKKEDAG